MYALIVHFNFIQSLTLVESRTMKCKNITSSIDLLYSYKITNAVTNTILGSTSHGKLLRRQPNYCYVQIRIDVFSALFLHRWCRIFYFILLRQISKDVLLLFAKKSISYLVVYQNRNRSLRCFRKAIEHFPYWFLPISIFTRIFQSGLFIILCEKLLKMNRPLFHFIMLFHHFIMFFVLSALHLWLVLHEVC